MNDLSKNKHIIDSLIMDIIKSIRVNQVNETLYEAIEYVMRSGGKRIRSLLLISIAENLNVNQNEALVCAVAIEMIHNYTLIHDDLPCMDDDNFRRGMPTCHKKFGEGIAVLAGNGLYTLSLQVLMNGLQGSKLVDVMSIFIDASGISGVLSGQANDIQLSDAQNIITCENDMIEIIRFYYLKTGKLFETVFVIPGILAGMDENKKKILSEIGSIFGVLYQLADDIADNEIKGGIILQELKESLLIQFDQAIDLLQKSSLNFLKKLIRDIVE